jgi:hypothetical protein
MVAILTMSTFRGPTVYAVDIVPLLVATVALRKPGRSMIIVFLLMTTVAMRKSIHTVDISLVIEPGYWHWVRISSAVFLARI